MSFGERTHEPGYDRRLAILTATYLLFAASFYLLGPAAFGKANYYWATALVCAAICVAAARLVARAPSTLKPFFVLVAVSLGSQAVESVTFNQGIYLLDTDGRPGRDALDLFMVFSLGYHFSWLLAWAWLAWELHRHGVGTPAVRRLVLPITIGIASLFAIDFVFGAELEANVGVGPVQARFLAINEATHMLGLLLGLICFLLGVRTPFQVMIGGNTLLAAVNFLYHPVPDVEPLEVFWIGGLFIVLAGLLMMPRDFSTGPDHAHPAADVSTRSSVSAFLLAFVLAAILLSTYSGVLLGSDPHIRLAANLVIAVLSVFMIHRLARGFERSVSYSERWAETLLRGKLRTTPWDQCEPGTRRALQATGLDALLERMTTAAEWLRGEVMFLGQERLNRPAVTPHGDDEIRAFIVMPFGPDWADEIHSVVRESCESQGIIATRGDDLFRPTDILDDIWTGLVGADLVIADITGRNPNVMYELGMAHTVAKPVLILSQSADDIPFDLTTRRVLVYGRDAEGGWSELRSRLTEGLAGLIDDYRFRGAEPPP